MWEVPPVRGGGAGVATRNWYLPPGCQLRRGTRSTACSSARGTWVLSRHSQLHWLASTYLSDEGLHWPLPPTYTPDAVQSGHAMLHAHQEVGSLEHTPRGAGDKCRGTGMDSAHTPPTWPAHLAEGSCRGTVAAHSRQRPPSPGRCQ